MAKTRKSQGRELAPAYDALVSGLAGLLDHARRSAARAVNGILTATYWEVGRRIVEFEQGGQARAEYGEALLRRLSEDLTAKHGRGFSRQNLQQMRSFYLGWQICQTLSGKSEARSGSTLLGTPGETAAATADSGTGLAIPADVVSLAAAFPLPWSHYVRLLSVENLHARAFYEAEALRGGWSVRQLDRQIGSQLYVRTALSKRKAAVMTKGQMATPEDAVTAEDEIRDPYLLEFLNLKDEYSENDLEEAVIRHIETFLLEMGDDFAFISRQRRLRIDDKWFRVDLLFFHRSLRALVLLDLKLGAFTHADAGQMNLYLNYAQEHWMRPGENPPVGLVLCAQKGHDEARYALGGLQNKVLAATYRTALPREEDIAAEIGKTRRLLERKGKKTEEDRTGK